MLGGGAAIGHPANIAAEQFAKRVEARADGAVRIAISRNTLYRKLKKHGVRLGADAPGPD